MANKPLLTELDTSKFPSPFPYINNPFPASFLGVSISETNKFPIVSKSKLPSLLKSSTRISLIFDSWACDGSDNNLKLPFPIFSTYEDANVLALGARLTDEAVIYQIFDSFLSTEFEGDRHQNRINKIEL